MRQGSRGVKAKVDAKRAVGGGAAEPPAALRDADHHVVAALMKWVEQGAAPERIIATRIEDGKVVRQRPICAFPAQAAYKGSGEINDAANFKCITPEASSRPLTASDMILIQSSLRQRDMKLPNR